MNSYTFIFEQAKAKAIVYADDVLPIGSKTYAYRILSTTDGMLEIEVEKDKDFITIPLHRIALVRVTTGYEPEQEKSSIKSITSPDKTEVSNQDS